MKAKIAVVTVCGKDYYLVVNELKRKNTPFLSLTPYEPVPIEIEVVITTEKEKPLIKHQRILIFQEGMRPEALINEALKIIQGKNFEKITIGVDPGEVFGLAVLADGKVVETGNCFSVEETLGKIADVVRNLESTQVASISVKIGDGVPQCKEKLLRILDEALPLSVSLESVSETGTNRSLSEAKHRRGLRDIVSAIQIAGRSGYRFQRRKTDESDS
ncbi:MAG: hypothetical protein ABSF24_00895 [Candidatus Bathyarchaeia archaeon]|jgi:hypothetical protein